MDVFEIPEVLLRLVITYLVQSAMGIIIFLIFFYFANLYQRKFLRTWSWSWLSFSMYMMGLAMITVQIAGNNPNRFATSLIAQAGCFLQVVFLLAGTYELTRDKLLRRRELVIIALAAVLLALFSLLIYNSPDNDFRNFLRYALRTFFTTIGFVIAGVVVWTHPIFTRCLAQRLLSLSIILYCFNQLVYFVIVVTDLWGHNLNIPSYFGLADTLVISVIGLSMVMWLLEDERERLKKTNLELDRFLYSTSHDLRAPIASILGLTYLGQVELHEEKARTYMAMIEERIKKLDLIIFDILALSRSKKFEVKLETINFNTLLDETIADVKFNKGAAAITLEYERNDANVFRSDYNQMKIILNNLIANAVKYHRVEQEYPFIRVIFKRDDTKVEITVEDNGQGIPHESVPKIFEMFYRASTNTEGTGLGLYIVKEALSKIRGTIFVQSEYGKRSAFTIVLNNA